MGQRSFAFQANVSDNPENPKTPKRMFAHEKTAANKLFTAVS